MPSFIKKRLSGNSGLTLAEIVIAMAISAIVFTGVLFAYTEGIRYTQESSSMTTLYNEGMAAMTKMGRYIREAGRVRIYPYGGVSDARLELDYPQEAWGGEIEFYFSRANGELRWSNRRGGVSRLHMILLPILDYDVGTDENPYMKVRDCRFTPLDHLGIPAPFLEGYGIIKIEMVLEDAKGDTLYISSVQAKRNKL